MRPLLVAANTIREHVRSKLFYNLLVFSLLIIAGSYLLATLTIGQWGRMITDVGLACMQLAGALISILLGIGLVAGEIDRRTLYVTLAKPLRRWEFLLGKYLGLSGTLALNLVVMYLAVVLVLFSAEWEPNLSMTWAAALILVELAVLSAFAVFFSTFTTTTLAAVFSLALFFIGHLTQELNTLAERSTSETAKWLVAALYRTLPNLELFNLKSHAADLLPVPAGYVTTAMLYGVLYAAMALVAAAFVFQRRDFK
jgi:ABC-type transport system involved in multi-copper enzyme maturation permease subunit